MAERKAKDSKAANQKRASGEGHFRQRANGSWEARVYLASGKRKSFYGKTRREVASKVEKARSDEAKNVDVTAKKLTVEEFLSRWLTEVVEPRLAIKTHASYAEACRFHINPALGSIRLDKLSALDVTRFLNAKAKSGLSPRTVQYLRSILRGALNRAVKWQLLAQNPVLLTDSPKVRRPEIAPLTPEQARQLLDAARGDRLEALYTVALALGLRLGEALGLKWEDVEFETGTLRVRRSLQRVNGKLIIKPTKTEKSARTLTMPKTLVTAPKAHQDRQSFEKARLGVYWPETDLIFTTPFGTALEASNVLKRFKVLLAGAGLPKQRFHDLRHCAASLLIAQGLSMKVIADILGHFQLATTTDLYGHVYREAHQEAADRMDEILAANS